MTPARTLSLGLLLTATAGFVDAVGFIVLGGLYTSFMSGNTTQIGTGAVLAEAVVLPLSLVAMFFLGSFVGSLIAMWSRRWGPSLVLAFVLGTIAVTLALAFGGFTAAQAMLVLAAGAGAQNATLPHTGGARLGTTFVSGTLFAAGQDLAGAVRGEAPRWRWLQQLAVWGALLVGALLGAFGHVALDVTAILVPGAVYLLMLAGFVVRSPVQAG